MTVQRPIGIMSAMPQEGDSILHHITDREVVQVGSRQFFKGSLEKTPIVFALAGVGKVSAAVTATLLCSRFNVREIIFTGVAGGGGESAIGDIVVGASYLQHDLDLRPILPQFHIFSLNAQLVHANTDLVNRMALAANRFFQRGVSFPSLNILNPQVRTGVIVSGDQFIGSSAHHEKITESTKELLPGGFHAIEMEGAAVAQACQELQVPYVVVRSISDQADHCASTQFPQFLDEVAGHYSLAVLREYLHETTLYHAGAGRSIEQAIEY